ncbi:Rieske (2Fe-2S) protein, partial [Amphibiibacter pelophylacis]
MSSALITEPQPLCASQDLADGGEAQVFRVLFYGEDTGAFALRFEGQACAHVNRCAHVPTELDWPYAQFWDGDRQWIQCSVHGALYHPHSGVCVAGPCPGARLDTIPLIEEGGQVLWRPDAR